MYHLCGDSKSLLKDIEMYGYEEAQTIYIFIYKILNKKKTQFQ